MCNGFRLAALFRAKARVGAGRVHEGENRPAELLGDLHDPQRLAIALGIRHSKISIDFLLGVASLLVANDQHVLAMETGHATDDGRIIGEAAVAMDLTPVGENALNVLQGIGALRMTRQLSFFPSIQVGVDLLTKGLHSLPKLLELLVSVRARARNRFHRSEEHTSELQSPDHL